MSHSLGMVFSKTKPPVIVGWYEYNGTADIAYPKIRSSRDEVMEHWRSNDPFDYCKDDTHAKIEVWIYSDYGAGYYWPGTMCEQCRLITSQLLRELDESVEVRGRPDGKPTGYDAVYGQRIP